MRVPELKSLPRDCGLRNYSRMRKTELVALLCEAGSKELQLVRKRAIINPHNDDEEYFKWSVITAENVWMKNPQRVSNLRKFADNYDWSGLSFQFQPKTLGSLK